MNLPGASPEGIPGCNHGFPCSTQALTAANVMSNGLEIIVTVFTDCVDPWVR